MRRWHACQLVLESARLNYRGGKHVVFFSIRGICFVHRAFLAASLPCSMCPVDVLAQHVMQIELLLFEWVQSGGGCHGGGCRSGVGAVCWLGWRQTRKHRDNGRECWWQSHVLIQSCLSSYVEKQNHWIDENPVKLIIWFYHFIQIDCFFQNHSKFSIWNSQNSRNTVFRVVLSTHENLLKLR